MSKVATPGPPRIEFDYKKVEEYAATGARVTNVARALGCCTKTVYNRLETDPKFKEAYEKGRARSEIELAKVLNSIAYNETADNSSRVKAATFILERVHGWYKTTEVKADVNANATVTNVEPPKDFKELTDEELDAQIRALEQEEQERALRV